MRQRQAQTGRLFLKETVAIPRIFVMTKLRLTPINGRDTLATMKRLFIGGGMFLLLANMAIADDSTLNAGASGPEPLNVKAGEQSKIRMVSEELEFHFSTKKTSVIATFHFLNTTKATIRQAFGFPDEGLTARLAAKGKDVPEGTPGPIEDMQSFVNGKKVDSKVEFDYVRWANDMNCWLPATKEEENAFQMAWHTLTVDFPPGREVLVQRRYTVQDGDENIGVFFFAYTVHTGSSWQGKIGRLRATVFLEGGLTVDDLGWTKKKLLGDYLVSPPRKEWKIVSPAKMTLEWDDFKPSEEKGKQDIEISARDKKVDAQILKAGDTLPTGD